MSESSHTSADDGVVIIAVVALHIQHYITITFIDLYSSHRLGNPMFVVVVAHLSI